MCVRSSLKKKFPHPPCELMIQISTCDYLAPRSWSRLRFISQNHRLKLKILKHKEFLPTILFTWNFNYPFMANKEFLSNLTLDDPRAW